MSSCPYEELPSHAWWRQAVADTAPHAVAPFASSPFRIHSQDAIATAGSCFAQEIATRLPGLGLRYLVTEPGPERLTVEERRRWQYGTFTARYGNIYTITQLRQLLERAYGTFVPAEDHWVEANGKITDPFRPSVEPGGFASLEEMTWSRENHLAAVRDMVTGADVLVFTLGLTETWRSKADGAVFPLCPGCGFGQFDPARHEFHNMNVGEVVRELDRTYNILKAHNSKLRLLLTVSPVPLVATMSGMHVLSATTYSKSVLRVAAQDFAIGKDDCCYFPSFEIIVGPHGRGAYYHENLRTVSRHGVDHVMRCFAAMFTGGASEPPVDATPAVTAVDHSGRASREAIVARVICDEDALQEKYGNR